MRRRRWVKHWRQDSFFSRNGTVLVYDKLEHFLLGFTGMLITLFILKRVPLQEFVFLWIVWNGIGLLWEYFQFVSRDYEAEPKDVIANNIGFILAGIGFYLFI